jgi:prepilin-type N-terminal cleavage/methylation domain-containing protein
MKCLRHPANILTRRAPDGEPHHAGMNSRWLLLTNRRGPLGAPAENGVTDQTGFTLIETAIVLVIVGILLAGILKGNELIVSARVRDIAAQQDQVRTAYLAFFDRFRGLPGDYRDATASIAGVTGCGGNGNGNGRIEGGLESTLAWEHLSKAGFIAGSYTCDATQSPATTPINAFGVYLQLVWDGAYADPAGGAGNPRHNMKTGNQVPSNILAEIDRKIDDGRAVSGFLRFSDYDGGVGAPDPLECYSQTGGHEWHASRSGANCGGAVLF